MKNQTFAYDIILSPVITEKSTNLSGLNKITFKVSKTASKTLIKKSIERKTTYPKTGWITTTVYQAKYQAVLGE